MKRTIKLSKSDIKNLYKLNLELGNIVLRNFSDKELGINDFPISWESLKTISGSFINPYSDIRSGFILEATKSNRNMVPTREDAESQLAECQLRQLAKSINDNKTEEEWINWKNASQNKFHAYYDNLKNVISININSHHNYKCIYFKRKEDLERSLIEHKELWLQYFKATQ